jgi:hypothetical protein
MGVMNRYMSAKIIIRDNEMIGLLVRYSFPQLTARDEKNPAAAEATTGRRGESNGRMLTGKCSFSPALMCF